MKKKVLVKLLILFGSLSACFSIFEIYLRVNSFIPNFPVPPYLFSSHSVAWWTLTPNFAGEMTTADGIVEYRTNSMGIRASRKYSNARENGKRIFIIGDSFTFGIGVNIDSTFSYMLNDMGPDSAAVINLGVPGYGTMQSYHRLLETAEKLGLPDQLLYVFCPNDPVDNLSGKKVVVDGIRIDSSKKFKILLSKIGHLYYRSRVLAFLLDRVYVVLFNPRFNTRDKLRKSPVNVETRKDFLATKKYIGMMNEWAIAGNVNFMISTTGESEYSIPLEKFLSEINVPLLKGQDVFGDARDISLQEGHWNRKGHRMYAEALERFLGAQQENGEW